AVDIKTGNRVWELGRVRTRMLKGTTVPNPLNEDEADKSTDAFRLCLDAVFLGPPLPVDGHLYVLIEHTSSGIVRLLRLDPKNLVKPDGWKSAVPALVWSQKLGKPNATLPGDALRRPQGAFLAASDGIIVCPTNSGVVVGIDTKSRSLLWARDYRKM